MRDNLTVPSVQTIPVVPLDRLRFADHLQAGDVVGWPQGPGEPLALTEALVAQRHALEDCALLFGLTQSGTLRPELVDAFRLHALNGAGTSRRVTSSAEIFPCHVSSIPGRSEEHTPELQSLMRISYAVFCLQHTTPQI